MPEIIDPVFAKTSPKRSFCMTENEHFGLVFVKTKGLVAGCHSFCLFFIYYNIHTFIQSHSYNTFIHRHSLRSSLHFLIACLFSGEAPPCGAEPRIELEPALQQVDALPTEPRRTIRATPHRENWVLWRRHKQHNRTERRAVEYCMYI